MKERSLHARLVAGAVFWTLGILAAATALAMFVVSRHPRQTLLVHNGLVALSGAALVTAGVSVIRRGLSPFRLLRERLADVRDGRTGRLEGSYPSEVVPLVDDLNALLGDRERRVARAVARAGDLAHGLKTPLAILMQDTARADAAGQHDLAESIRLQVDRMSRQIDFHLSQARVAASGASSSARVSVAEVTGGLVRAMTRLHAERVLAITADVAADHVVRVPLEDLEEMIGNLLDNACKWAKARVVVSASRMGDDVVVRIDDDGPGLEAPMRERVLQRGVRADEATPGSGLGLAIVRDLADGYGGSIRLEGSPEGGLRATLKLPAASAARRVL
ncbi:MAG: HAMP domain-containing sensor histidine kinase [Acidobacteriota bacterium]